MVVPQDVDQRRQIIAEMRIVKRRRNVVVHEVALEFARAQAEFLNDERRAVSDGAWEPFAEMPDSDAEYAEWVVSAEQTADAEIESRIVSLESAYEHLVRAGGLAFRIEQRTRPSMT